MYFNIAVWASMMCAKLNVLQNKYADRCSNLLVAISFDFDGDFRGQYRSYAAVYKIKFPHLGSILTNFGKK